MTSSCYGTRFPSMRICWRWSREYRAEIRKTPLAIDDPNAGIPTPFPECRWRPPMSAPPPANPAMPGPTKSGRNPVTRHAFETLVKTGSDADPHCIACHTVGFGKPSGYRRPMGSASLVDVGCESCHGPASEHIARYRGWQAVHLQIPPARAGRLQDLPLRRVFTALRLGQILAGHRAWQVVRHK